MNNKTLALSAVAIAIVGGGAYYGYEVYEHQVPQSENVQAPAQVMNYKNGTYSVTQKYTSPGGDDSFGLNVSLLDSVITESTFTNGGSNDVSKKLQDAFAENYKSVVIGKNINNLQLDTIAGASLTTDAFKKALDAIKNQAK